MNHKFKFDRRLFFYVLPVLALACYLPTVIQDTVTYRSVVAEQLACCGFVSENWMARPVTYALVDEWTMPVWKENAIKSERFLTSDGIVNGQTKFWRLLERKPLADAPE
ncbi:hypothetical protein [Pseudomonas abietaniphila]|uniref:Uncharacterized protein n=1 Tax=Pseudomonas abietaniphila TaxID=89065 RepID=A0A1G8RRZ1_9PSED|nr:hypothetical protein [Pseudomonas abietaniphila]SDJ19693.1 hypothetical protein SAMN05216605_12336 [Pseudomonas abietaniphila]